MALAAFKKACGCDKDGQHYPPDSRTLRLWLRNRQKDKWPERQEVEHTGAASVSLADAMAAGGEERNG